MANRFKFTDPKNANQKSTNQADTNQADANQTDANQTDANRAYFSQTKKPKRQKTRDLNNSGQNNNDESDYDESTHDESTHDKNTIDLANTKLNDYDKYEAEQDAAEQNGETGPTFQGLFKSAKNKVRQMQGKEPIKETNQHKHVQTEDSKSDDNYNNQQNESNSPQTPMPEPPRKNGCLPKLIILGLVIGGGWYGYTHFIGNKTNTNSTQQTNKWTSFLNGKKDENKVETNQADKTRYKYPSERDKKYPSPYQVTNLNVSLKDQKIYVMNGKNVIYTMLMTSGKNDTTPKGNFQIQAQQGKKSWSEQYKRGMNYWSSYKGDGQYVFSTIWTNKDGSYRTPNQNYLGIKPSTDNGNIQLTTPDAKFVYGLILGTPIKIY